MKNGPVVTLWHPDGPEAAWSVGRALLERAKPRTVQVHSWSVQLVADKIRATLGDVELVCGFGLDSIAREVAKGRTSITQGIRTMVALAQRAHSVGAVAITHNAEGSWKRAPNSAERARLSELVRGALGEIAARFPAIEQVHTAYDHPSFHASYNWNDWLGPHSPITTSYCQVYAAPGDGLMAHRGALAAREARALKSWAAAVRAGWIVEDDPSTTMRDGVEWRPYFQLHHVPMRDTAASALGHKRVALWAVPSRVDRDGRAAFLALCELDRRGYWRPDGLVAFQRCAGITADNVLGPETLRALEVSP